MTRDITKINHRIIQDPALHIVLYQPEIPANTGNIARLCGAAELRLHLIHPLGFKVDDKHLKRAGLDYWYEIDVRHHRSFEAFLETISEDATLIVLSKYGAEPYTMADVKHGDYLLFGRETSGLPLQIRQTYSGYSIPMWGNVRSLNLSTSVGIVAYHFLHQVGRF
jgi:tRNA (cytidine/uridine-2'-O-)-methyltransferase